MDDQKNNQGSADPSSQNNDAVPINQPGTLIIAHDENQKPNPPAATEQNPEPQKLAESDNSVTSEPGLLAQEVNQQNWQYQSGQLDQNGVIDSSQPEQQTTDVQETPQQPPQAVEQPIPPQTQETPIISWQASEFASNNKTSSWYIKLVLLAILLAGVIYAITRDIISSVVICLLGATVGAYGALKPRILNYSISNQGVQVGDKQFVYEEFRSFAVIDDGSVPNVMLLPHKKFMIPVTMYFNPQDGDKIVEILGEFLPYEHKEPDFVDRLSSRIRF